MILVSWYLPVSGHLWRGLPSDYLFMEDRTMPG